MRSMKFPNMFNSNGTRVWKSNEYLDATKQNTMILLHCERGEMFGDPYLGLMFKHYLFSQNSTIMKDIIIDTIYTQIALFIPQVRVARKDISIVQDREKGKLYCTFKGVNQIDFTNNTYSLLMYDENEIGK